MHKQTHFLRLSMACPSQKPLVSRLFCNKLLAGIGCGQRVIVLVRYQGIGKQVAKEVSEAFPPQINLKFENVMCPLMLLNVNRYAGKIPLCL